MTSLVAYLPKKSNGYKHDIKKSDAVHALYGFSDEAVMKFYQTAIELIYCKRFEEAADAFVFLTTIDPQVSAFWQGLGRAEGFTNHWERALGAYLVAIGLDQSHLELYAELAGCCVHLGNRQLASDIIEKAGKQISSNSRF